MSSLTRHIKTLSLLVLVILMLTAVNMTWIERPVLSGILAFNVHIIPGFVHSQSFGVLGIILSIFLLLSLFIMGGGKEVGVKIWPGIACILLSILFFINVAFLDPARFKAISDEVETYKSVLDFSKVFLPPNLGIEPVYSVDIEPGQVMDRIMFTWQIMGWGWFIFSGSAIIWLFIVGRKEWFQKNIVYLILVFFISLIPTAPYFLSKYYTGKANAHWAEGGYSRAVKEFEFAKRINPALGYSQFYNINLGRMYYYLGRGDNPFYYLYSGTVYAAERRIEEAEDAYSKAVSMSKDIPSSSVIRNQYADFLMTRGMAEFRKKRVGDAIANLRRVAEIAHDHFMAHFILSKILYDTSQFEQAIAVNKYILQISVNPILNASVNANIGDCYSKLGEYNRAREFYEISVELKRRGNFRAFEDLGGT